MTAANTTPLTAQLLTVMRATRECIAELLRAVPPGPMRQQVLLAAKKVNLAASRAETATGDELRAAVDDLVVRTTELKALTEDHPDPLARWLSVARRVACVVLGDDEADSVVSWTENLERGETAGASNG